MSIQKEYREFFTRHIQINSGTKPDQETGFPLKYFVGTREVFNRFLKDDYPSEKVFKKLFQSIAFKLNKEDTAKLTEQGLGKIATDAQSKNRSSNASIDFTAFVVPHQLTEVIHTSDGDTDSNIGSGTIGGGIFIQKMNRAIGSLSRLIYKLSIAVTNSLTINENGQVQLVNDIDTVPEENEGQEFFYGIDSEGNKGFHLLKEKALKYFNISFNTSALNSSPEEFRAYYERINDEYEVIGKFIYPGTNHVGEIKKILANIWVSGFTANLRISDATNNTVICEITEIGNTSPENIVNINADDISNLPEEAAVFLIETVLVPEGEELNSYKISSISIGQHG